MSILPPSCREDPAVSDDLGGSSVDQPTLDSRDDHGTNAAAAGQRNTDTAFPDAHAHPIAPERRDEFDIRAFRKQRMMFDSGAVRFDVDHFRVDDEKNAVRIPTPTATGPENPSIRSGKSSVCIAVESGMASQSVRAGPISTVTSPLAAWLASKTVARVSIESASTPFSAMTFDAAQRAPLPQAPLRCRPRYEIEIVSQRRFAAVRSR